MPLVPYLGTLPTVGEDVEIDAGGFVIGKVTLGRGVRIGARTVLRGDQDEIVVGEHVRFGQAVSVHMDPRFPTRIGSDVVVEDEAIVHGCVLGDGVLVERDATILTGSSVGAGSIVQAGALVPEGKVFPARSVIAGTPGKVVGETTDDEVAAIRRRAHEQPRGRHE
jgi:carbonic anhydrase/acetyltransferase-like protein (isoleucine patch superfamily)